MQQILELLLRDIPHYKDELANAVQPADYSKLSKITHKIQGVTCYACLPRLKSQVQSIQQQLIQQSYSLLDVTVDAMIDELEQIRLQIELYLRQEAVDLENVG